MGLGKTLQAIAVAYYFKSEWPVLIVVPSSLRYTWIEELEKWLPDILPQDINLIQGGFDTAGIATAKITIVTYGLLSCNSSGTVKEALKAREFKVAISDESHYFKNARTACCKAVSPLLTSAARCILLSGTPALAKPAELFTQLDALQPGKFGSFWSFSAKYCAGHWQHFGRKRMWKADGASNLDELQRRLQTLMIRREKSKVLTQLPPKQRQKILFPLKESQTKKEIVSLFEELKPLLKRSKSSLAVGLLGAGRHPAGKDTPGPEGAHTGHTQDTNILSRIQRIYNLTGEAKIGPAREYVQMLCENGSLKFLVFAYHRAMLDGLQQTLWDHKVKFVRIDGQTPSSDRQLYVQQFQSDKDTRVALLSILAAGVGLTFTAASLVVFAELYWTPGVMVQCEDRAHRIGQTSTVPVHYLVARDTMDEWVWSAVCRKTLVTSTALTGKSQALQADAGDRYQVELLSAAEAYTPVDNADIDVSQLVQSQRPQDQRSILDFFGSQRDSSAHTQPPTNHDAAQEAAVGLIEDKGDAQVASASATDKKRKRQFPVFTSLKKPSTGSVLQTPVIIHSSDDDEAQVKTVDKNSSTLEKETVSPESSRNDSLTKNGSHTKKSSSRKRKCVEDDADTKSDSEFTELPFISLHSAKKKKKKGSTRPAPSVSKPSKAAAREELEQSRTADKEWTEGEQWSCSSCTFFNSGLLLFCEMCETPHKVKGHMDGEKHAVQNTPSETAKSSSSPMLEDEINLSPPVGSSTRVSKPKPVEKCLQTAHVEQDSRDNQSGCFTTASRHRVKRNLVFGDDQSATGHARVENGSRKQSKQNSDMHTLSSSPETESDCMPEADRDRPELERGSKTRQSNVTDDEVIPDSELGSFQLNSSMEKDDWYGSPCLFDSEEEDGCEVNDDHINHISSFSSEESTGACSIKDEQFVTDPQSSASTCVKKSKSADLHEVHDTPVDCKLCGNDTDVIIENKNVETRNGDLENDSLPEIKPPKRKSFMLGPPKNQMMETSPTKDEDTGMDDSSNKSSDITNETCEKNVTSGHASLMREGEHSDSSSEKRQNTPTISTHKKGAASCSEADILAGESYKQNSQSKETSCISTTDLKPTVEVSGTPDEPRDASGSGGDHSDSLYHLQQSEDTHSVFVFCCSYYTGRVYLFDEHGESLGASFLPLDVELDNVGDLPDILHHPPHLRLAQHFVRQWSSLTDTKRRLIVKKGLKFRNPLAAYDTVRTDMTNNKQRYHTKEDQTKTAMKVAREVNGQVRVLTKRGAPTRLGVPDGAQPESSDHRAAGDGAISTGHQGYVQVLNAEGTPLCVHCQQPCSALLAPKTSSSDEAAWNTRFCSRVCADAYWMKTNTAYLRCSVYDVQHGVCQLCRFDAHTFFCQIRDSADRIHRAEKINSSIFCKLGASQKKQMIAKPYEGQFWQVDHIRPVWDGGGQCDIDNLRTLCTPCHLSVTAKQAAKRAHARKLSRAACAGDITAFFKKT